MFTIQDPAVQAQLNSDYAEGRVPEFDPTDETKARTFVDYWNALVAADPEAPAVTLNTHTYYSFTVNPEPTSEEE